MSGDASLGELIFGSFHVEVGIYINLRVEVEITVRRNVSLSMCLAVATRFLIFVLATDLGEVQIIIEIHIDLSIRIFSHPVIEFSVDI